MRAKKFLTLVLAISCLSTASCKHPLTIVGKGDIKEITGTGRQCTLEQFEGKFPACTHNEVTDEYMVSYEATPRHGWRFVRWDGFCNKDSAAGYCELDIPATFIELANTEYPGTDMPTSTAVFESIAVATNGIRVYAPGDRVDFEGTATVDDGFSRQVLQMSLAFEFFSGAFEFEGKKVMAMRAITLIPQIDFEERNGPQKSDSMISAFPG